MKRIDIIKKLLKEGFTERTLSILDDKQLLSLNKIMVNEQPIGSVITSKKTPITDIKNLTKGGLNVELREKNNKEEEEKEEVYRSRRKRGLKNRSSKLVEKLVENKYFHNFTSKGDIVKLIKSKLNESSEEELPDFLTSRSIKNSRRKSSQVEEDTITKPTTKPKEKEKEKVRKNPFNPGPKPKTGPQAEGLKRKSSQVEEDTITKPTTKPKEKEKEKVRKNPFNPGPKPKTGPQAKKR
jgi:hypothetical protein